MTSKRSSSARDCRSIVGAAVAVVFAAGVLGAWAFAAARALERDATVVRSPLIGNTVPAFELPALDGGPAVSSEAYEGEILVVNFWASWCVPCRAEAPELEAFARRHVADGVNLVGIVYNDDSDKASAFRDEFGLTFPQATDPGGRAAIDYGVRRQAPHRISRSACACWRTHRRATAMMATPRATERVVRDA